MGVPFALASKTGGEGEDFFFFNERLCYEKAGRCTYMVKPPGFFFAKALLEQVHLYGEATRMYWGTLYSLVCCMTNVDPI